MDIITLVCMDMLPIGGWGNDFHSYLTHSETLLSPEYILLVVEFLGSNLRFVYLKVRIYI